MSKKICIIGDGTFACAIAILLNKNGHNVSMYSTDKRITEELIRTRQNRNRLPNCFIPNEVNITGDKFEAAKDADLFVFAVASLYTRVVASEFKDVIEKDKIVVTVTKGIEEERLYFQTEIINNELPGVKIAVLSGPSHAEEVALHMPTTVVVGAYEKEVAEYIQDIFMSDTFRVYISPDVEGIELGASIKNVIALAAGVIDGLGCGDNAKAALMTRGIHEISRLGEKMGSKPETFNGLSGIGDLIVTCMSKHSRNRNCGYLLGQGYTLKQAEEEIGQVVEGVYSAKSVMKLAKLYNVEMPICEAINKLLFEGESADKLLKDLIVREKKKEHHSLEWN